MPPASAVTTHPIGLPLPSVRELLPIGVPLSVNVGVDLLVAGAASHDCGVAGRSVAMALTTVPRFAGSSVVDEAQLALPRRYRYPMGLPSSVQRSARRWHHRPPGEPRECQIARVYWRGRCHPDLTKRTGVAGRVDMPQQPPLGNARSSCRAIGGDPPANRVTVAVGH